eukprot:350708-Chlamydomonas_euryale.AAC.2
MLVVSGLRGSSSLFTCLATGVGPGHHHVRLKHVAPVHIAALCIVVCTCAHVWALTLRVTRPVSKAACSILPFQS